jgi:hypothetical protein
MGGGVNYIYNFLGENPNFFKQFFQKKTKKILKQKSDYIYAIIYLYI